MNSDPTKGPPTVDPQASEAELPQAPPGAPEGHDSKAPADGRVPDADKAPSKLAVGADPEVAREPGVGEQATEEQAGELDLEALIARASRADEYLSLAQRTQADFENYRKRAMRESAAAQERGATKLALALLPAVDNLERALAHAPSKQSEDGTASFVAGVKHVHDDVLNALKRAGIEPFSPQGETFDPQLHEAVAQQPVPGAEPGTVVEVFQRGYRVGESVLRPARVVVAG
jgi:molecular chaperone GrpE